MTIALNLKNPQDLKIGFIGAGRLGTALARALADRGFNVYAISSRSIEETVPLTSKVSTCKFMEPQDLVDVCDLIFVTTPDGVIKPTADRLKWTRGSGVVHCSGATEISALENAAMDGAFIGGFHPMQTFGDIEAAVRTLPGCVITVEAQGDLLQLLTHLIEKLQCTVNELPNGARARYHAAAGFASQYVNVLLFQAVKIWESWGGTESAALAALFPVIRGTLSSIESAGLSRGMPGPVSRGDIATVKKHLSALAAVDSNCVFLYSVLCLQSIPLAEKAGGLSPELATQARNLLNETLTEVRHGLST